MLLPIVVFIFFLIIDIGSIMSAKSHLENKTSDIINALEDGKNYDYLVELANKDSTYHIDVLLTYGSDNFVNIELAGKLTLLTPGLNKILNNPYAIKVKRVVPYE